MPQQRLLLKLLALNIDPDIPAWIKSFLCGRSHYTVANDIHSNNAAVNSSISRGSVFRPLLFFICINDPARFLTSPVRVFAEHRLVYRQISNQPVILP